MLRKLFRFAFSLMNILITLTLLLVVATALFILLGWYVITRPLT